MYPKSASVRRVARVKTSVEFIADRRRNFLLTIADRPILEECRRAERRRGSPPRLYWWEQEWSWTCPWRKGKGTFWLVSHYVVGRGRRAGHGNK